MVKLHALWLLLNAESDRDGYWLRPDPWEGPGEYQHAEYADGRDCLIMTGGEAHKAAKALEKKPPKERGLVQSERDQLLRDSAPAMLAAMRAAVAKWQSNPDDLETMDTGMKLLQAAIDHAEGR